MLTSMEILFRLIKQLIIYNSIVDKIYATNFKQKCDVTNGSVQKVFSTRG
jgi:hypothetical protein